MYICIFFNNQTGEYIIQDTKNPVKYLAKLMADTQNKNGEGWKVISETRIFGITPKENLKLVAKEMLSHILQNDQTLKNYLDLLVPRYQLLPENLIRQQEIQPALVSVG